MLGSRPKARAHHGPDHHRGTCLAAEHIAELGGLVEYLVETDPGKIDEHQLGNRSHAAGCRTDGRTDVCRFRQRSIQQAIAEFLVQPLGHPQHTAPGIVLTCSTWAPHDILSHHDHAFIACHFLGNGFIDRQLHAQFSGHLFVSFMLCFAPLPVCRLRSAGALNQYFT